MSEPKRPTERRLHPRFTVDGQIDLGGREGSATLRDLSMSGLSCHSPTAFEEMTVLEISMKLPGDDGHVPLKVGGAVVRSEPEGDGHVVAIFFTQMDDENRRTLESFLERRTD